MARRAKQAAEELRALSDEELITEMDNTYRELFSARLQLTTMQLANTSLPRKLRHRIARIKTIQREREIASALRTAGAES